MIDALQLLIKTVEISEISSFFGLIYWYWPKNTSPSVPLKELTVEYATKFNLAMEIVMKKQNNNHINDNASSGNQNELGK